MCHYYSPFSLRTTQIQSIMERKHFNGKNLSDMSTKHFSSLPPQSPFPADLQGRSVSRGGGDLGLAPDECAAQYDDFDGPPEHPFRLKPLAEWFRAVEELREIVDSLAA